MLSSPSCRWVAPAVPAIFSSGNAAEPVATETVKPEPPGIGTDTIVPVPLLTGVTVIPCGLNTTCACALLQFDNPATKIEQSSTAANFI